MPTDTTTHENTAQSLSWGLVELQVIDLQRTIDFWTDAIGIELRAQDDTRAELGTRDKTLIALYSGARRPVARAHLGMYHVAIGVPDQAEFSRILARLIKRGVQVGPTDHLASKSIYFTDPNGLEIEIIFETPERFGHFGDLTKGLVMYDTDGNPHSGRAPLDVPSELTHAIGADFDAPLSPLAVIAHVHFKVDGLDSASEWFAGVGFTPSLMIPAFGFADMGAGGSFSHRLAMNIWSGRNLSPAPEDMARLMRYTLHIHDPDILTQADSLQMSDTGRVGTDPTGTQIHLIPAPNTKDTA